MVKTGVGSNPAHPTAMFPKPIHKHQSKWWWTGLSTYNFFFFLKNFIQSYYKKTVFLGCPSRYNYINSLNRSSYYFKKKKKNPPKILVIFETRPFHLLRFYYLSKKRIILITPYDFRLNKNYTIRKRFYKKRHVVVIFTKQINIYRSFFFLQQHLRKHYVENLLQNHQSWLKAFKNIQMRA